MVVTGAAGRTGAFITQKLAERSDQFQAVAIVRSQQSAGKVASLGVPESGIFFVDVSAGDAAAYSQAFNGADAVVVATSAVPKIQPLSLIKVCGWIWEGGYVFLPFLDKKIVIVLQY